MVVGNWSVDLIRPMYLYKNLHFNAHNLYGDFIFLFNAVGCGAKLNSSPLCDSLKKYNYYSGGPHTLALLAFLTMPRQAALHWADTKFCTFLPKAFCSLGLNDAIMLAAMVGSLNITLNKEIIVTSHGMQTRTVPSELLSAGDL